MKKIIILLLSFSCAHPGDERSFDSPVVRQDESNEEFITNLKYRFGSEWENVYRLGLSWLETSKESLRKGELIFSPLHQRYLSNHLDKWLLDGDIKLFLLETGEGVADFDGINKQFCELFEALILKIKKGIGAEDHDSGESPSFARKIKLSWLKENQSKLNNLSLDSRNCFGEDLERLIEEELNELTDNDKKKLKNIKSEKLFDAFDAKARDFLAYYVKQPTFFSIDGL
jgi:hypothetical protein